MQLQSQIKGNMEIYITTKARFTCNNTRNSLLRQDGERKCKTIDMHKLSQQRSHARKGLKQEVEVKGYKAYYLNNFFFLETKETCQRKKTLGSTTALHQK
ncbi:hypothetical protein V6Z11_D13G159600 [Gossypium hirsutum]